MALIGQAARYHRKGNPSLGAVLAAGRATATTSALARMSTLLRLAEDLERSRDQVVRRAHASVEGGIVRLDLVGDGDVSVPRWAAGREVELFARAFDRALVV